MLVLTPKYGSLIDIDLLKKQKEQKKDLLIKHRMTIDLTSCKHIKEAYLAFLDNTDKYIIGYKPKNANEINEFVKSLCEIDTFDASWLDVSELCHLDSCFNLCGYVKHIIGLEKWDVSNVRDMSHMFFRCDKLESIDDISGWDVSNVNFMYSMFENCKTLKSIDISRWDVSNVKSMHGMFYECQTLESIGDLSRWNVSNVEYMNYMFARCYRLENVGDIEHWKRSYLIKTDYMFDYSVIKPLPSWYKN